MKRYDLIAIGSGPAGEKAAVKAAYFGHSVALVEKSEAFGGAGAQTGTVPSKTLKETALYLSGVYQKGVFGVDKQIGRDVGVQDFMYRKDFATQKIGSMVEKNIVNHGVDVFRGKARFLSPHEIHIDGELEQSIEGDRILIATGSYPYQPPGIPFEDNRIHDSDSILDIRKFPKSICVLGAGVIGCEYATIFSAMGTKPFIVNDREKILGFLDNEISEALVDRMSNSGVSILFNNSIESYELRQDPEDPVRLKLKTGEYLNVDMFLFAAGRSGNIRHLDLDNAGVETGARETILVNESYQTNVPHIYAVGDVIGFPALASSSMEQGRIAVAHMFETKDLETLSEVLPFGIYTVPEVSTVGLSEDQAKEQGLAYGLGYSYYRDTTRGMIMGDKDNGFLKLVFDADSQRILGAHIIGNIATELIHYGMSLVRDGKTLNDIIGTVFNYPTLHELYKYAAYDGLGNLAGKKLRQAGELAEA